MFLKFIFSAIAIMLFSILSAQSSQKMKEVEQPNTYETLPEQKKPLQSSFRHNNESKVVRIKESTFKSYPRKKRKAILAEPERYIIVEE